VAKRSKWTSKGWWKYQARRPRAAATKAVVSLASRAKALRLLYFPTKLSDDELFAKLTKDVVEIKNHITMAFKYRKIFRDTTEMLQKHPTLSTSPDAGYWYDWLRTLYAHYIVMSVRRELDRGATSPNLFRLLHEISKRPEILSRARYEAFFEGTVFKEHGLNVWDTQFTEMAGPGAFIDPKVVRKDIDEVDKQAKLVVLYANKIVAHRTTESVQTTLKHVNDSLEAIEKVLQKYYSLLTGGGLMGAEPSIINNWQAAFTVPWISPVED
jgi:hypothetical protein